MHASPACPNGDTAFLQRHVSQRTILFIQYSKWLWISTCSSFLLKKSDTFWILQSVPSYSFLDHAKCVCCVDSDDVCNFIFYYFPMKWLICKETCSLCLYMYCDLENLKVFLFLPKWQESHLTHMGLKLYIPNWVEKGVPGYLKWIIDVGFSGSKRQKALWVWVLRDGWVLWMLFDTNTEIVRAALRHPEGVA